MDTLTLLGLAVSLAMDAMAVAAARGLGASKAGAKQLLLVALWFGGAQGVMPLLGALIGKAVGPYVASYQHWLSAMVLVIIAAKMIRDALAGDDEAASGGDPFAPRTMFMLALATSIDALAVGFTLPTLGVNVLLGAIVIALVTGLLSALGLILGRRLGALFGKQLDILGGVILLLIAVRIVREGAGW